MRIAAAVCTTSLGLLSLIPVFAQQTRTEAVAGMRKVEAKEMDPTYTKAAPVAQKLIDDALARHPEVLLIAIHAAPPGHKNLIVASNFGRIGKIGDEDDMRCIHMQKPNLEVDKTGKHFEAEIPMYDQKGSVVGALGVVFNYKAGDDKLGMQKIADEIEREMKAQLPTRTALFARGE